MKNIIDLSGDWNFKLDDENIGIKNRWYEVALDERISLPGSTDAASYGVKNIVEDRYRLSRIYEYVGAAWYQKEINISGEMLDKNIILLLERCHWETRLWVDGIEIGMQDSLCICHKYDVTKFMTLGKHTLTIRVDNNVKYNVGKDAHSVTKETQTNWNGIVGKIQLEICDKVHIEDVQVYPDLEKKSAKVCIFIENNSGKTIEGTLCLNAGSFNTELSNQIQEQSFDFSFPESKKIIEVDYGIGEKLQPWDEFSPVLYNLSVKLEAKKNEIQYTSNKNINFGMRNFKTEGTQFVINGRKTFLRGTLECCVFPLTAYPDMDVESWIKKFDVIKGYGLNHVRFHSWCPPEVAFEAADMKGLMLQIETPVWTVLGEDPLLDKFIYDEGDRILKEYGNHPSFCMMTVGNEPSGDKQVEFLNKIVNYWKNKDSRHLYTGTSGWPEIEENDYHCLKNRNEGVLRCQDWAAELNSRLNAYPLTTDFDFSQQIDGSKVPIVSHEVGQWCTYPNLKEMKKYTGVLEPRNFKLVKDSLAEKGMLDQAEDFLMASGKLQTLLYKEDIEAALRTSGFGGFQLLGLSDFPGQGTALVGVVDAFWENKGYAHKDEFRKFCSEIVPLARMKKVVWKNSETFNAAVEIANFGAGPMEKAVVTWTMDYKHGGNVAQGEFKPLNIPVGNGIKIGNINARLDSAEKASELVLSVAVKRTNYINDWNIWVYPEDLRLPDLDDIVIIESIEEANKELNNGKKVLLLPSENQFKNEEVPAGFTSIFWNTQWTNGQKPNTLGLLCNPESPALEEFVTDFHSNWQWFDLIKNSKFMCLDKLPKELRPIVQIIDDWNKNRKVGLVFEAKVGKGKLLLCSIDLKNNIDERPVARQLKYSLLKYMKSSRFEPKNAIDFESLKSII